MEDSGIDSDPKIVNHVEDERLFLVNPLCFDKLANSYY